MVEDNTIVPRYYSGSGTNQITFRGVLQSAYGYIGFNTKAIVFNGSDANEEDGKSILAIRQENTVQHHHGNCSRFNWDCIATKVNGAITTASTVTLDNNSGTIVGMKVYGQDNATPLTDENSSTDLSQDGSLTVTATNGSTSVFTFRTNYSCR